MSNANTVAWEKNLPGAAIGVTSSAETQFLDATGAAAFLQFPGLNLGVGVNGTKRFKLKLGGRVAGEASATTVDIKVYANAAVLGSGTKIADSTAKTITSLTGNWYLDLDVTLDNISDELNGLFSGQVAGVAIAATTLSSDVVNVGIAGFPIYATATMSTSNSGNLITLDFCEVDAL